MHPVLTDMNDNELSTANEKFNRLCFEEKKSKMISLRYVNEALFTDLFIESGIGDYVRVFVNNKKIEEGLEQK